MTDAPRQPILEHLEELRWRLVKSAVALTVGAVVAFFFRDWLFELLESPYRRAIEDTDALAQFQVTEGFSVAMRLSLFGGMLLASPVLLYQLWAFVSPGLHARERRMVVPFMLFGTLFFGAGGLFGYTYAVPIAARWLIGLGQEFQANITLQSAFHFESVIILGMGVVFELPIVIFFLARVGLVTPAFLMRHFRTAVLLIAIISAIITPTAAARSMASMAVTRPRCRRRVSTAIRVDWSPRMTPAAVTTGTIVASWGSS